MKITALLLLLSLCAVIWAAPQNRAGVVLTPCDLHAYITDPDPQGLNVRTGPGTDFPALGAIPRDAGGTLVHVVGASGKWLKISEVKNAGGAAAFPGTGFVFGELLGLTAQNKKNADIPLYKEAYEDGGLAGRLKPAARVKLVGCSDNWAQVQSDKLTGWLDSKYQCGNPAAACP